VAMQQAAERYMRAAQAKEAAAERQWQAVQALARSQGQEVAAPPEVLPLFRSWRSPSKLHLAASTAIASAARGMSDRRRCERVRAARAAMALAAGGGEGGGGGRGGRRPGERNAARAFQPTAVLTQMVGGLRTAPILLVRMPGSKEGEK
jgi:hypothetical protein